MTPLGPSQDPLQALLAKVQRAEQEQNLEEAARLYKEILRLRPHWIEAEFNLGTIYYTQKNYPEAIGLFNEVIRQDRGAADAYLFQGVSYYQTDQYTKALASLKEFSSLKPEDPQIHYFLGAVYSELGDYSNAALQDLEQLKNGSDQDRAYYQLGKAYQALADEALKTLNGKREKDHKVLEEALKPGVLECQQSTGLADGLLLKACLNVSEDLSAGTRALREAQRRAPGDEVVMFWSFRLYSAMAESAYAKLVARSPNSALAALLRADSLEGEGKRPEAAREYQRAIQLSDSDPEPLISYGKFEDKVGQYGEAIGLFQRALALDPSNLRTAALLGEAYVMNNQPEQAASQLDRVVRSSPEDNRSRIYFAEATDSLGHVEDAIKILEQADSDEDGRIHYMLGKYYLRKGEKAKADQAFATFQRLQRARKNEYGAEGSKNQ